MDDRNNYIVFYCQPNIPNFRSSVHKTGVHLLGVNGPSHLARSVSMQERILSGKDIHSNTYSDCSLTQIDLDDSSVGKASEV